jgi:Sortase domain
LLAACSSTPIAQEATIQKPPEQVNSGVGAGATKAPAMTITPSPVDDSLPVHLSVPSVGINAPVEQVGILANGDMATPPQNPWIDAGWYRDGPSPGEQGSAVIDGHLDRPGGYPAVFWYLRNVHVGDAVYVTDKDGQQLRFHVTHIAYFMPQNAPLQDIFGNRSGIFLNLITCAGDWIPDQHQTTLRLVVYTTLG